MSDDNATPAEAPAGEQPVAAAPAVPPSEPEPNAATAETIVSTTLADLEAQGEEAMASAPPVEEVSPEPETPPVSREAEPSEPGAEPAAVAEAPAEIEPATAAEPAPKKKRTKKAADEPAAEVAEGEAPKPAGDSTKRWYVVKVQSGREDSIKRDIERKVIIQGLEEFFGRIEIPVEEVVEKKKVKAKVKDKKTGEVDTVYQEKNVTKKRKKFPGYIFAEVDFNDRILYLFRETSGVGDFVGASQHKAPNPMSEHEVQSMLTGEKIKAGPGTKVKVKLDYEKGDKVKIRDGAFSGMEGEVKQISEAKDASETPKVKVEVTIFGRPVEVELDYWQVDKA